MRNDEFSKQLKLRIYTWTVRLVKYLREVQKKNEHIVRSILEQLMRSGTSVCANYIEAIGSPSSKDFRKFLSYALKSGNESKFWLTLLRDTNIDKSIERDWLIKELVELCNILGKSVSTLYKVKER